MSKQHKNITNDELHDLKDFSIAANETAAVKDVNGDLEWRSLTELGSTGPAGPAGTTLVNIEVADINDASPELLTHSGVIQGDVILIHEEVSDGPNPFYIYTWDTNSGDIKIDPPFIIKGDGGTWVNSNIYFFKGKCSLNKTSPSDYHGRISHVHRQGRWYGIHIGGIHQMLSRNGYERSDLAGTDVSFHEQVENKVKTKTLSSNTTLTFSGYQLLDQIDLEIQSASNETLTFPSYSAVEGVYNTDGTKNYITCKVNNIGSKATGTITVTDNSIDAGDSLIINGVPFTEGSDWAVGTNVNETAFNICRAVSESNNPDIVDDVDLMVSGAVISVNAYSGGLSGNLITMVKSDGATNNFTLSGPALTGGLDGEVLVKISQANTISITDLQDQVDRNTSTGIISGGELSVNSGDDTKFDIADGNGVVVDSYTNPNNTTRTDVSWTGLTAVTVIGIGVNSLSHIGIDSSGTVVQQVAPFTSLQRRTTIVLGVLAHTTLTNVQFTVGEVSPITGTANRLEDIAKSVGIIKVSGNEYSANGANLNIDVSASTHYSNGSNYATNKSDPDLKDNVGGTAISWFQNYRNGSGGTTIVLGVNSVDSGFYDDGSGTLAVMPSGKFQTKRVYFGPGGGSTVIEYGQTTFDSMASAEGSIFNDNHIKNPELNGTPLTAWIIVKEGVTDLSDSEEVKFIQTDKFGQFPFKNSTTSTTSLGEAYSNSVIPQITTDSTRGALTIKEGAGVGGELFDIQDESGTTMFSVDSDGNAVVGGTVDGRDINVDATTNDAHIADLSIHRPINDAGTSTNETWSASKIDSEISAVISGNSVKNDVVTSTFGLGNITLSGEQTLNGVTTVTSRVIVTDQLTASGNGIYVTGAGAWSRATDYDGNPSSEVANGDIIHVNDSAPGSNTGSSTKNKYKYLLTTQDPITVGATGLSFVEHKDINFGATGGTATEGNDTRIPTQDENDALAGTDGIPSTSNSFVTNSDSRNSDARTPTLHSSTHLPSGGDSLATGISSSIGTSNTEGSANAFARQDHIHDHGTQSNQLHHMVATESLNGFLSSTDKVKLNDLSFAWLQYGLGSDQTESTALGSTILNWATDLDSFPNSQLTKLSITEFRADVACYIKISYGVEIDSNNNNEGAEIRILKNGTSVGARGSSKMTCRASDAENFTVSKVCIVPMTVNDVIEAQITKTESNTKSVTAINVGTSVLIEVIKLL